MSVIRWEPARELHGLFGTFFDSPTAGPPVARRWTPSIDVVETDEHYVLKADLPGISENDVKVELHGRVLTVSGQREERSETTKGGYYRLERSTGAFARSLTLPAGVDPESIRANLRDGVLEVQIAKPASVRPQRVQIKVGGAAPAEVEAAA
jgi:HSP20 family protein